MFTVEVVEESTAAAFVVTGISPVADKRSLDASGVFSCGCVFGDGAAVEVGPSPGSVDVDVFVRYNAVCINAAGESTVSVDPQFHTPRPGKISCIVRLNP